MKFCFGDIVVVDADKIGVVVKSWINCNTHKNSYDVYVRLYNKIIEYEESKIERYMVRHKYLDEVELEFQRNAINGL